MTEDDDSSNLAKALIKSWKKLVHGQFFYHRYFLVLQITPLVFWFVIRITVCCLHNNLFGNRIPPVLAGVIFNIRFLLCMLVQ